MKAKSWFYHLMSREQGSNHSWDLRLTCSFFSFNFLLSASFPRTVVTSFGQSLCLQKRCNKCHSGMNIYTNEQKHGTGKLQKFEARPTDYVWSGRGIKLLSSIWRLEKNRLHIVHILVIGSQTGIQVTRGKFTLFCELQRAGTLSLAHMYVNIGISGWK